MNKKRFSPLLGIMRILVLAVLAVLMISGLPQGSQDSGSQYPEGFADPIMLISTDSVETLWEDRGIRIIDAREAHLYRQGHIPGALSVPVDRIVRFESRIEGALPPDNRLAVRFGVLGIGADTHVVIYDDKGGRQASRLVWALHYLGHPLVSILYGGFNQWKAEKRPTTQEVIPVNRNTFPMDLVPRRLATAGWIYEHLNDPEVVIVDVRVENSYSKDHIPGAISLPWQQLMNEDYTWWKSAQELKGILEPAGVTKDKDVVVYSDIGQMAALPYVILRALGYPRVRSYDRSWAEWGNDFSLPKAGKTSPQLPLLKAIFRANGCANCHGVASEPKVKGVTFTDSGKTAAELGNGCINLLSKIANLSELKEQMAAETKQTFEDHGCVKCHDVEGAGATKANLTDVGVQFQNMNLGCIDMMFVLR